MHACRGKDPQHSAKCPNGETEQASTQDESRGVGLAGKRCSVHCYTRMWARSKPAFLFEGTAVLRKTYVQLECSPGEGLVDSVRQAPRTVEVKLEVAWG